MTDDKKQQKSTSRADDSFGFDDDDDFDDEHLYEDSEFEAEGWSIPHDPESVTRVLKSLEGLVPGILRRAESNANATGSGSGAAGSGPADSSASGSEESTRSSDGFRARLGGVKLPREVVNFILAQVDTTKREFLRIASNEVRVFLESVDLGGEVAKILTSLSFEVRMEVRFIPNDQALKPSARGRMRVKRKRAAKDEDLDDVDEAGQKAEGGRAESEETKSDKEETSGREFADVFKPRRWSLRRRPRPEDQRPQADPESHVDDDDPQA